MCDSSAKYRLVEGHPYSDIGAAVQLALRSCNIRRTQVYLHRLHTMRTHGRQALERHPNTVYEGPSLFMRLISGLLGQSWSCENSQKCRRRTGDNDRSLCPDLGMSELEGSIGCEVRRVERT